MLLLTVSEEAVMYKSPTTAESVDGLMRTFLMKQQCAAVSTCFVLTILPPQK